MGVFEDFFVKAKSAVDAIGEKAGQYVDVSKLNIRLAELKNDLKNEYESLGKTIYKSTKNGEDGKSDINVSVAQIDNMLMQIDELKNQIAVLKNKVLCKSCEHLNEVDSVYCAKCGEKLLKSDEGKSSESEKTALNDLTDDFEDFDD